MLVEVLLTVLVALVPMLELRAAIPLGIALGLPPTLATLLGILGNLLQIQVAIACIRWAYRYCSRHPRINRWLSGTEAKVNRYQSLIRKWGWAGLAAFVLLPLPGTGVWGGVVLARLIGLPAAGLWMGLTLGIAASGALFGLGTSGAFAMVRGLW